MVYHTVLLGRQKPITIQVNGTNVDIKGTARMGAMCERTGHGIIEDRMRKSDIYMTASTLSLALALNLNAVLNETDEGCYTRLGITIYFYHYCYSYYSTS